MNCPNCKTPTLISLSPVSWFCFKCGKFHTEFRLDGLEDELKAPDSADAVMEVEMLNQSNANGKEGATT